MNTGNVWLLISPTMSRMKGVLLAAILLLLPVTDADIQAINYPQQLEELYKAFGNGDATNNVGESIASYSISMFAFKNKQRIKPYVPPEAVRNYVNKMSHNPLKTRRKRGIFLLPGQYRTRKEYRLLTTTERDNYHWCMNQLKWTHNVDGLSGYDALAAIHSAEITAHRGVNFLGWHRVYLWTLENALRNIGGRCSELTLPYWDCTAEYYADIVEPDTAKHSVIFSDEFAGSGNGFVGDGAFGDWGLVRNVAAQGELFSRTRIEQLKTFGTNDDIANYLSYYSIERNHNGLHRFIGGGLLDISRAPYDPMFFLLHCYIDYVWEEVRQAMIARQIDPSVYPWTEDPGHRFNNTMDGFEDWTNEEGYSSQWYERHVRYQQSYSCQPGGTCDSIEGLQCISINFEQQCTSVRTQTNTAPLAAPTTTPYWWKWWNKRKRRDVTGHATIAIEHDAHVCNSQTCKSGASPLQNTFTINDVTDTALWVYIPVKVIYERPRGLKFQAFASYIGKTAPTVNSTMDIYDPAFNPDMACHLYTGEARPYDSCRISGAGATKVFIRADGINYSGNSMEYGILDDRYPLTSQKVFVPIKDPTTNDTEVCLMAYDSCGRLCLPTCFLKGSYPPAYAPCTGCIRVNSIHPKMYGRSVADIVADQWTFYNVGYAKFLDPTESDNDMFLKFVCDASSKFPWQRQKA